MVLVLADSGGTDAHRKRSSKLRSWKRSARVILPLIPSVAIVLVVALLGVLLWYVDRDEREEQHLALIKDTLWVEQALRFHFGYIEENLRSLAASLGRPQADAGLFAVNAERLISNVPGVTEITLQAVGGSVLQAMPPTDFRIHGTEAEIDAAVRAGRLRKPVFTPMYATADGDTAVALVVPVFDSGGLTRTLTTGISLGKVLADQVPWWVAERNRVTLVDDSGKLIASKSDVRTDKLDVDYKLALNPPGGGIYISVAPYRTKTQLVHNALVAAIFVFAVIACLGLYGIHRHMRRRIQAEKELRSEHAFRKSMEDSLTVGMRARDLQGSIIYVNPAFCRMIGWTEEELIGHQPPMPYFVPGDSSLTPVTGDATLDSRAPLTEIELKLQRRNGERFDALVREAPLIDADGNHCGWMGTILDITDRRRAEELSRLQAEKLSRRSRLITMGELASTLAHELNQPLAAIAGYAIGCLNKIKSEKADVSEIGEAIEKLATQAQRAGSIISRVLDFARKREPKFGPVDSTKLLNDVAGFMASAAREQDTTVIVTPEPALPSIQGDRILLEQALLNLVRNGFEAIANTPREARMLTLSSRRVDHAIEISVADRGSGIADEIRELLFTPFVTTKREGMGMGLNICRSIVEMHKGRLWCEARPGGGTTFTFTIPLEPA